MNRKTTFQPGVQYLIEKDYFQIDNAAELKRPVSVCIHINRKCNLHCTYCLSNSGNDQKSGIGDIGSILTALSKWGKTRITWSGGEPLIEPNLDTLLKKAKKNNMINILTTNGTIMPKQSIIQNIDWIDISIHGTENNSFIKNTGKNHFKKVMGNVEKMINSIPRVATSIVLTKENANNTPKLARRLADIGVNKIRISTLLNIGRGESNKNNLPSPKVIESVKNDLLGISNETTIIMPALNKYEKLYSGYFVIENDGTFSSPPSLVGSSVFESKKTTEWTHALSEHKDLFSGITD